MSEQTLGDGLKLARSLRNLSLREVEKATGISNPYLSQLENNKITKPSPFFLHKLANLYNIDYEMLMQAAGYVQKTKDSDPLTPKTLAGAALFSVEKLSPEEEQKLAEYLQFLRSKK